MDDRRSEKDIPKLLREKLKVSRVAGKILVSSPFRCEVKTRFKLFPANEKAIGDSLVIGDR